MQDPASPPDANTPAAASLPGGKIPPPLLERLLALPRRTRPEIILGPKPGEDAAVVAFGPKPVAVTADPITFPTPRPGWYAVHVNANDLAVTGAKPDYFTLTILLPPGSTEEDAETIMRDALAAAEEVDAALVGGHTEVTAAVNTPVISVTMFGTLLGDSPMLTGGGRAGDAIIQVNPMALEGTTVLAAMYRDRLEQEISPELVSRAASLATTPGLSVLKPAMLAQKRFTVHAMHDPTEGGLATGLREMAEASGLGLDIHAPRLLVRPETLQICNRLKFDPFGLLASGCLLLAVPEEEAAEAVKAFQQSGYGAARIGYLTARAGEYRVINKGGDMRELPAFEADELTRPAAPATAGGTTCGGSYGSGAA
jgi:hydrogenase maturation factor